MKNLTFQISEIRKAVSAEYKIPECHLDSPRRFRAIVEPRQTAHYLSSIHTGFSLAEIGQEIGNKDHATVLNSITKINNLIETDKQYKTRLERIYTFLQYKFFDFSI